MGSHQGPLWQRVRIGLFLTFHLSLLQHLGPFLFYVVDKLLSFFHLLQLLCLMLWCYLCCSGIKSCLLTVSYSEWGKRKYTFKILFFHSSWMHLTWLFWEYTFLCSKMLYPRYISVLVCTQIYIHQCVSNENSLSPCRVSQGYPEELTNIIKGGVFAGLTGLMYGGLPAARHARQRYIQSSQAEIYTSRVDAVVSGRTEWKINWSYKCVTTERCVNVISV